MPCYFSRSLPETSCWPWSCDTGGWGQSWLGVPASSGQVWFSLARLAARLHYPQRLVLTMGKCYGLCAFVSTQDNCTLSDGHAWTRAICSVCIDFPSWTLYFSYLTVLLQLLISLFVVSVWVDGSGFQLVFLLTSPHFEKFKSFSSTLH